MVAAADDRDRIAARVAVLAGGRQGDVDGDVGRTASERDQRLARRRAAQHRRFDLPAHERGDRGPAGDGLAGARDEQPDGAAVGVRLRVERRHDDDADVGCAGRPGRGGEQDDCDEEAPHGQPILDQ